MKIYKIFFSLTVLLSLNSWGGDLSIDIELNPVGNFTSKASTVKGNAEKDPKGGYVAKNVSLVLNDLSSGVELRDHHMKEKYFETAKFPIALMKAAKGNTDGNFKAKLLVHGKEQVVGGTYKVDGKDLKAEFKTSLSAFGISKASYMGVGVVDEVTVKVTLPIK